MNDQKKHADYFTAWRNTLTAEEVRAVCSRGGKTAHKRGTAHKWDSTAARKAARKAAEARRRNREARLMKGNKS